MPSNGWSRKKKRVRSSPIRNTKQQREKQRQKNKNDKRKSIKLKLKIRRNTNTSDSLRVPLQSISTNPMRTRGSILEYSPTSNDLLYGLCQQNKALSQENNTLTYQLIADEYTVELLLEYICIMHNVDNSLDKVITRLLLQRESQTDAHLHNFKNIDIITVANRIQKAVNHKFEGHQNQGELFRVFASRSENRASFTPFTRVVGDRKQWEIQNIEACMSRRTELGAFAMKTKNGKHMIANARELYEYSKSKTLLKESIIMTNISRMYVMPLMLLIARDVKQMKYILPILQQSLVQLKHAVDNKVFALRILLTLTPLVWHQKVDPHILCNDLLNEQHALLILESTENISHFVTTDRFINAPGFLLNITNKMDSNHIVFADKYFANLFSLSHVEFENILTQLQGAYYNLYIDLQERYLVQSTGATPKSTLSTNDITESLNSCGKYQGTYARNISENTKNAHALNGINKEAWNTWDFIIENDPREFERLLSLWLEYCGTYKQAVNEKKERVKKYHSLKWTKLRITVNTANEEAIPTQKVNPAKGAAKINVFKKEFQYIAHPAWIQWVQERNQYLSNHLGILVSQQRRALKQKLEQILSDKTTFRDSTIKAWGLDKRQQKLHEYCTQNMRR